MYRPNKSVPARSRYLSLYGKLGVSPNASAEAIRDAYEVLQATYCPGGVYIDDAMYQSFCEIRKAAEILCNRKTRRLYDLGFIDENGRQTEAGRARNLRFRTAGVSSAAALAVFAVLVFNFWTSSKSTPGGVQVFQSAVHDKAAAPPARAIANPAPLPPQHATPEQSPKAEAAKTAAAPGHGPVPIQLSSQTPPPPQAAFQQKGVRLATPKERSNGPRHRRAQPAPRMTIAPETRRRNYSEGPERRRRRFLAEGKPPSYWESGIWFPRRPAYYGQDLAERSATLRSARCLACLADGGDCPGACP